MNKEFIALCDELHQDIGKAYEEGTTLEEAERLAAKFLSAQMVVAKELEGADLDRRMRKRGLKTIRSAIRMEEVKKHDKKPTEGALEDMVNTNELVCGEETAFDSADVYADKLENYFGIFKDAHIYFRGVAKGRFE